MPGLDQAFASPVLLTRRRASAQLSLSSRRRTFYLSPAYRTATTCLDAVPSIPSPSPITPVFSPSQSALQEGIRAVAVGKFGSKPVPPDLIPALRAELSAAAHAAPSVPHLALHLQRASFLGALFVKAELAAHERELLAFTSASTAKDLLATVDAGGAAAGTPLADFALRLLRGERLSIDEAFALGRVLYASEGAGIGTRPVKALIAHVMRVRHEDAAELSGLARAAAGTLREGWGGEGAKGSVYALVSEPFDGTVTWDLLTPLLCAHLQRTYGLRAVMNVGVSSGPKYGPNLLDVCNELKVASARRAEDLAGGGEFGVMVDQQESSPGLAEWVGLRRTIVKRPSVATTEKYVDPCPGGARLFIASAFHGNYVEKMAAAAEAVGFASYIIVGKGMEGSTGLGIGARRTAQLLTGWATNNGKYNRELVEYNVAIDGAVLPDGSDPVKGGANVRATARRIREFGEGKDEMFDARVKATLAAFDKAIARVAEAVPHVFEP